MSAQAHLDETSRLANTPAISITIEPIVARLVLTAPIVLLRVTCTNCPMSAAISISITSSVAGPFPVSPRFNPVLLSASPTAPPEISTADPDMLHLLQAEPQKMPHCPVQRRIA